MFIFVPNAYPEVAPPTHWVGLHQGTYSKWSRYGGARRSYVYDRLGNYYSTLNLFSRRIQALDAELTGPPLVRQDFARDSIQHRRRSITKPFDRLTGDYSRNAG